MEEEQYVYVPADLSEQEWIPPVIAAPAETEETKEEGKQSAADVFFMQYIVCILVLTALLVLRLLDGEAFAAVTHLFTEHTHAPSAEWAEALIGRITSLWS